MENRCLRIAILMLITISIQVLGISAQGSCTVGAYLGFLGNCKESVLKGTPQSQPSQACCDSLKALGIPCLCKTIPPSLEDPLSMEKVMYVATTCGFQIPQPGEICGSYTIPGPPPRHVMPSLLPLKT